MDESTQEQAGGLFRDRVHSLLRSSILDAAWAKAAEISWNQVRMADLADEVGVSRQTIYNEFGSKDDLVLALVNREQDRFLEGVEELMSAAPHFDAAMRDSITWLLDEVEDHQVLGRMVADARAGSTEGLIPMLTVHSDTIFRPVRRRVVEILLERWPTLDRDAAEVSTEHAVRFILGQLVTPSDLDRDLLVDGILAMTVGLQAQTAG